MAKDKKKALKEAKKGPSVGKKKLSTPHSEHIKKAKVEEETKTNFVNGKYVIPCNEIKPVKTKKKSKKTKAPDTPPNGIKLVKDKEALTVKMPEYDDSIYKNKPKTIKETTPEEAKTKKKAKKAPINIGSTRVV